MITTWKKLKDTTMCPEKSGTGKTNTKREMNQIDRRPTQPKRIKWNHDGILKYRTCLITSRWKIPARQHKSHNRLSEGHRSERQFNGSDEKQKRPNISRDELRIREKRSPGTEVPTGPAQRPPSSPMDPTYDTQAAS